MIAQQTCDRLSPEPSVFSNLLESRPRSERNAGGHVFSIMLHVAVVAFAIVLTRRVVTAAAPDPQEHIDFVTPEPAPATPVVAPRDVPARRDILPPAQILVAPIDIPDVLPAIDLTRPVTDPNAPIRRSVSSDDGAAGTVTTQYAGEVTYFAAQVERPAVAVPGTGVPEYPPLLRDAGIEGEVRVQFVVDTAGKAEAGSIRILSTSHALFTDAVRKALAKMRFRPAETGSRKVRQIVELPFAFSLR
jgi:protein TonB